MHASKIVSRSTSKAKLAGAVEGIMHAVLTEKPAEEQLYAQRAEIHQRWKAEHDKRRMYRKVREALARPPDTGGDSDAPAAPHKKLQKIMKLFGASIHELHEEHLHRARHLLQILRFAWYKDDIERSLDKLWNFEGTMNETMDTYLKSVLGELARLEIPADDVCPHIRNLLMNMHVDSSEAPLMKVHEVIAKCLFERDLEGQKLAAAKDRLDFVVKELRGAQEVIRYVLMFEHSVRIQLCEYRHNWSRAWNAVESSVSEERARALAGSANTEEGHQQTGAPDAAEQVDAVGASGQTGTDNESVTACAVSLVEQVDAAGQAGQTGQDGHADADEVDSLQDLMGLMRPGRHTWTTIVDVISSAEWLRRNWDKAHEAGIFAVPEDVERLQSQSPLHVEPQSSADKVEASRILSSPIPRPTPWRSIWSPRQQPAVIQSARSERWAKVKQKAEEGDHRGTANIEAVMLNRGQPNRKTIIRSTLHPQSARDELRAAQLRRRVESWTLSQQPDFTQRPATCMQRFGVAGVAALAESDKKRLNSLVDEPTQLAVYERVGTAGRSIERSRPHTQCGTRPCRPTSESGTRLYNDRWAVLPTEKHDLLLSQNMSKADFVSRSSRLRKKPPEGFITLR
eukprot:TRINITY_DN78942_c0_g1_i1.p1 TRINITY_DN78942_c0_g1~~TRINITY_DN78942_c0_g1_i1.p1  ORF type:complete len:626 (+),score=108.99 TRINITY_DN78942_c0_g1_i1:173-2050(+)